MEHLTKTQIVMLVLLVSFVTSLATGIVTVTLVNQAPQPITHTIGKVIEKVVSTEVVEKRVPAEREVVIVDSEKKMIEMVKKASSAMVKILIVKEFEVKIDEESKVSASTTDTFENNDVDVSSGAGFFVSKEGHILTSAKLVENRSSNYFVIKNDGIKLAAKVISVIPEKGIAVLKVEGNDFDFIEIENPELLSVGQSVVAIDSSVEDSENFIGMGIISGIAKSGEFFYTEAIKNIVGLGGPILNLSGMAIGIAAFSKDSLSPSSAGRVDVIKLTKEDINDVIDVVEDKI